MCYVFSTENCCFPGFAFLFNNKYHTYIYLKVHKLLYQKHEPNIFISRLQYTPKFVSYHVGTEKNSTTNQLRFVSCENAEKSITLLLLVAFVM